MTLTARAFWNEAYTRVLTNGIASEPRGRKTIELRNTQFIVHKNQHIDQRVGRSMSIDYLRREFLWYMLGNRYDTRIANYAPIWKTCIDESGAINSNYGQYLFQRGQPYFFRALDWLVRDQESRRCWIPIIQSEHVANGISNDVPCHTGFGFRLISQVGNYPLLEMSVHHRSLDMWHGAVYDFPIAFMWQLMAQAYLLSHGITSLLGPIVHNVESAHFYERHIRLAVMSVENDARMPDAVRAITVMSEGFYPENLYTLMRTSTDPRPSALMYWLFDIEGDYGHSDPLWSKYYVRG